MQILFFGTKSYDKEFFEKLLQDGGYHDLDITFIEPKLTPETARLSEGYEAVCAFVNMDLSEKTEQEKPRFCALSAGCKSPHMEPTAFTGSITRPRRYTLPGGAWGR